MFSPQTLNPQSLQFWVFGTSPSNSEHKRALTHRIGEFKQTATERVRQAEVVPLLLRLPTSLGMSTRNLAHVFVPSNC